MQSRKEIEAEEGCLTWTLTYERLCNKTILDGDVPASPPHRHLSPLGTSINNITA
jgi:hypothetical protein